MTFSFWVDILPFKVPLEVSIGVDASNVYRDKTRMTTSISCEAQKLWMGIRQKWPKLQFHENIKLKNHETPYYLQLENLGIDLAPQPISKSLWNFVGICKLLNHMIPKNISRLSQIRMLTKLIPFIGAENHVSPFLSQTDGQMDGHFEL